MNYSVGHLKWDDYPPFAPLGEPWNLPDGRTVEGLLLSYEAMIAGEDDHGLTEHERETLLHQIETESDLKRVLTGMPGNELVIPRLHRFMRARQRTPAQRIEPAGAVRLAQEHMARFGEVRDRVLSDMRYPQELLDMVEDYAGRLIALDIRFVSAGQATVGARYFNGQNVQGLGGKEKVAPGLVFTEDELRTSSLVERAAVAMFPDDAKIRDDLGDAERPANRWRGMATTISGLTDAGSIVDYLVSPVFVDRFDGEPYYRLWEGGASMWIGTDAIEVRTDWARRWPNSRYLD